MSFRLFIYYCAAWGAAAALFGWVFGRVIESDATLMGAALKGMFLGLCLAVGLSLLDAIASGAKGDKASLSIRLILSLVIGALGGFIGGFFGQAFYKLSDEKLNLLLVFGWMLTGVLIGAAPCAFDYIGAIMRNEQRLGTQRKLRNGLIGGTIGGFVGGLVSMVLHGLWGGVFKDAGDAQALWSPSLTGFVALGACIGLSVALTQIILREATLRVEAGFRPGRQLLLTKPETVIGRAESCDLGLFGDAGVEMIHARIKREGNTWTLSDVGTSSGTLLNGKPLTGPAVLHTGDRIQVGGSVLSFEVRTKEPASASVPVAVPVTPSAS